MFKKLFGLFLILGLAVLLVAPVLAAGQNNSVKLGSDLEVPAAAEVDSAVAIGGSVTVLGKVKQDVVAIGGSVYLKNGSSVGGNVTSIGGVIAKDPNAQVAGDVTEIAMPGQAGKNGKAMNMAVMLKVFQGLFFFLGFMGFVAIMLIAIVLVALFTPQVGVVSHAIEKNFWLTFFAGILAALVFIPGIFVLLFTVIGIIFIPVWVILFAAAKIFGLVAASHLIGKQVLKAFKIFGKAMILETLMGALILYIFSFIPIINLIVLSIAALCGIGAVAMTRFGSAKA